MFTSVSYDTIHAFPMDVCYIFIFLSGRKDDEMDPMDPSAYSDAPRYNIYNHDHQQALVLSLRVLQKCSITRP